MTIRPLVGAALAAVLLATGCSEGDSVEDAGEPTEAAAPEVAGSTPTPTFEGDPDSAFCERSREAADEPVLDPFEAGLEPREVELRFRALTQRFDGFAEIAPEPLEGDLALLDATFGDLAALLEDADYDFEQLAADQVDVSVFDDPALAVVAERIAAYQDQVCGL